jgi:uncharacterized membrane protein
MKNAFVASSLAAAVTLALAMQTMPVRAADPAMEKMMKEAEEGMTAGKIEKCYGVNKAAKNDCQTATASCAGSSTKDFDKAAFVIVPTGTCNKLAGGSLSSS